MQAALLRVLERAEPTRSATYVWRVAFSVVTNELRRQRRRDEASAAIDSHEFVLRWNAAAGWW